MEFGTYGAWRRVGELSPRDAAAIEDLGYGAIWVGGSPPADLDAVEAVLAATRRIPIITGVVNMWRADPDDAARSYHRLEAGHPGRFFLGLGIGHPEATSEYRSPYRTIVEYLDRMDDAGVPRERMVLAALGPRVLRLAAERTLGAHPYLTTPRHTALAREVVGNALLAPEHKVVLDEDQWRRLARPNVERYLSLVNYRSNLLREGWDASDVDEGSDRLVEALVLGGDTESVAARLEEHLAAGADHVCVQVLGDDPVDGYRRLADQLLG
jgi:probable F420-dependent oxidoreductase